MGTVNDFYADLGNGDLDEHHFHAQVEKLSSVCFWDKPMRKPKQKLEELEKIVKSLQTELRANQVS